MDHRWINGFFDFLSLGFAKRLLELKGEERVDSRKRWVEEQGASFEYWVMVRFWLVVPFVHSDQLCDQDVAAGLTEEVRVEVEKVSGKTDPYRVRREELMGDVYAFRRMLNEGIETSKGVSMEEFVFWTWTVLDVHRPIIVRFGKYPYQDLGRGRSFTEEERVWTATFKGADLSDSVLARRIRDDVVNGRWTPLGGDEDGM